jgi:hypothetical protein
MDRLVDINAKMNHDDNLIKDIIEAIQYFLQRQIIAKEILIDLGITPAEIVERGSLSWIDKRIPQKGISKSFPEWSYFLHGKECRVVNNYDGEIIDWHCVDVLPTSFDPHFFLTHLKWKLKKEETGLIYVKRAIENDIEKVYSLLPLIYEIRNDAEKYLI